MDEEEPPGAKTIPKTVTGKLIRWYGTKTPEEIAELTGLDPMDVAKATEEAIGTRDYLAEDAEIRVTISLMREAAAEIMSRLENASDRNIAPMVNAASSTMTRQLKALEDLRKRSEVDLEAVHKRYAQEMVRIVERSYERQLGKLSERYPEVAQADLEAEFREIIREIAKEIDSE